MTGMIGSDLLTMTGNACLSADLLTMTFWQWPLALGWPYGNDLPAMTTGSRLTFWLLLAITDMIGNDRYVRLAYEPLVNSRM